MHQWSTTTQQLHTRHESGARCGEQPAKTIPVSQAYTRTRHALVGALCVFGASGRYVAHPRTGEELAGALAAGNGAPCVSLVVVVHSLG